MAVASLPDRSEDGAAGRLSVPVSGMASGEPTDEEAQQKKIAIANLLNRPPSQAQQLTQSEGPQQPDSAMVDEVVPAAGKSDSESRSSSDAAGTSRPRRRWTPEEDARLRVLVEAKGPKNWNVLAQSFVNRSGRQVRLRYMNNLKDGLKSAVERPFTPDEDAFILEAQRSYGNRWSKIAAMMDGRSDNSVKNRVHVLMRREKRSASERLPRPGN
mmetsp:Transcript_20648/g.50567  ORF Transcript_20648/g.50567 Transcript_20648/m.50567 type:complete len:214 (-) Transcript_20648:133-774(-)